MEFKVVLYILLFVGYYGYQAYRKLKNNAKENKQIPSYEQIPSTKHLRTESQNPIFDTSETPKEYVTQYQSLEDLYAKKEFVDTIEAGMSEEDRKPVAYFIQNPKVNKTKEALVKNLKNKNNLKSAFFNARNFATQSIKLISLLKHIFY